MMAINLDKKDKLLLELLQNDGRMSNVELARRISLSPPGLQKRLRRLEDAGIIDRHVTLVNREAVGFDMLCFVQVTLQRHEPQAIERFRNSVQDMPEVMECYHVLGEYDYMMKIIVPNRKHLEHFLMERLMRLPGMDRIRTSLVLSDIKLTTAVPINKELEMK